MSAVEATPSRKPPEFSPFARRLFRTFVTLHALVYRLSGGRVGRRMGAGSAVLLLTTTGRKTGKRRTLPLSYFEDGDSLVVVGAMGGAPKHPAWVHNLRSDRRAMVQVGSARRGMLAREARGIERRRLWSMLNARSSAAFDQLQEKTTREFPVVVLSLAEDRSGA